MAAFPASLETPARLCSQECSSSSSSSAVPPISSSSTSQPHHSAPSANPWGFAASRCFTSSAAPAHEGCGHNHDHGHHEHGAGCSHSHAAAAADDVTLALQQAADLQQLTQVVQQPPGGTALAAGHTSTALSRAVELARAASEAGPEAATAASAQAAALLDRLAAAAGQAVAQANVQQLSDVLMALTRLGCRNDQLWGVALSAITPQLCSAAGGRELGNIAYAIAATVEGNNGSIPGASREQVEEALRVVTAQLVAMVQGPGGISQHTHSHDGDCDHSHEAAGGDAKGGAKGGVSVYHISMVRHAHEVLESFKVQQG